VDAVSYLETVVGEAIAADEARDRSQQTGIGWSGMAGCRAYMGFKIRDAWETDDVDTWRAIAGTALHHWLQGVRLAANHDEAGRTLDWEVPVSFGGIPGHVDEVRWGSEVTDYKFPSLRSARLWDDPEVLDERFVQVQGYAAALVTGSDIWAMHRKRLGAPEVTVRIVVAPVDGVFADWRAYERPFDPDVATAAVARYKDVERMLAAGEPLPQDKPWHWCERFCEHYSACRGGPEPKTPPEITDPELAAAIERYGLAREVNTEAEATMKELRPVIEGLRGKARGWRVSTGKGGSADVWDKGRIESDYADSLLEVPVMRQPRAGQLRVTRLKEGQADGS
jgi:hypothetical protein